MTGKDAKKTLRFKMSFPKRVLGDPLMHRLSQNAGVVPNILRGRITEQEAWLEVEMIGNSDNIEKAVLFLKEKGVSVSRIEG